MLVRSARDASQTLDRFQLDFMKVVRGREGWDRRVIPGFHRSVAVSLFPLCKFRKNYVSAVRITLPT